MSFLAPRPESVSSINIYFSEFTGGLTSRLLHHIQAACLKCAAHCAKCIISFRPNLPSGRRQEFANKSRPKLLGTSIEINEFVWQAGRLTSLHKRPPAPQRVQQSSPSKSCRACGRKDSLGYVNMPANDSDDSGSNDNSKISTFPLAPQTVGKFEFHRTVSGFSKQSTDIYSFSSLHFLAELGARAPISCRLDRSHLSWLSEHDTCQHPGAIAEVGN